jgi:hypothetical protein
MKTAAFAFFVASAVPLPTAAQRDSSSLPTLVADQRVLVGKYHFEEEGISIDVSLNADGTALYSVGGSEGIRANGYWTLRGDRIHIFNRPGPVRLEATGAPARDPKVALRVVARLPDGSPANGLAVTWPNSAGLYYMSDGRNETRLEDGPVTGEVTIVREADSKELASFVMRSGAPNDHRFIYHPSDVEPFDYEAMALDPRGDVLEVEVGSASAKLRRVRQ